VKVCERAKESGPFEYTDALKVEHIDQLTAMQALHFLGNSQYLQEYRAFRKTGRVQNTYKLYDPCFL
jgi:hypothetical protein